MRVLAFCTGIVLMPGDTLPLKVVRRQDRAKLEAALSAAAPYTRLIAVVGTTHLKHMNPTGLYVHNAQHLSPADSHMFSKALGPCSMYI